MQLISQEVSPDSDKKIIMEETNTTTSPIGVGVGDQEPDHDTIKMFVGQIPRQWNEPECRKLFEKYGPVYSMNILRDRTSQGSKGCCFVTFFHRKDAIAAQGALHNKETIEGMHHPIQMKPADTENRNDRKLFVGQLSKKHSEEDVRTMFSKYGHIEDCSVLRDSENRSRGCAFVTFSSRTCAVHATKEMHHSQTMEGCTAPVVVKFADTQKDKDIKKPLGGIGAPASGLAGQALLQQLGTGNINLSTLTALASLLQGNGQQQNVLGLLGTVLSALGKMNERENGAPHSQQNNQSSVIQSQIAGLLQQQPQTLDALAQLQQAQLQQQHHQQHGVQLTMHNQQQVDNNYEQYQGGHVTTSNPATANQYSVHQPIYQTAGGIAGKTTSPLAQLQQASYDPLQHAIQQYALNSIGSGLGVQAAPVGVGNGDVKGPEGSNLFIYHLPQDFGDSDLMSTFSPFGTVLSAKVYMDKLTNLSKCFGFVSYDNAASAQQAINAMNGFQIGSKRLKVQLKNDRCGPYTKVA